MKIDIDFGKMYETAKKFVLDNKEIFVKGAGWIGFLALCHKLNIPINLGTRTEIDLNRILNNNGIKLAPDSGVEEEAIVSMMEAAEECIYDSDKIKLAEDIFDIASKTNDPKVRKTAIKALSAIASDCVYNSDVIRINKYIAALARSEA